MEILNGIVDSIVFKSDDTGYVVSKIRTEKDSINAVGIAPFLKKVKMLNCRENGWFINNLENSLTLWNMKKYYQLQ